MYMKALLWMPLLGVIACDSGKSQDSAGDDSGPKESLPDYEDGCITVDGGGGYKYIQDAITVAEEGSVILLCNGTYAEAVTVDKGVEILGESREGVIVVAPANAAAFTITGSEASVHTLTVQTSKDGILFEGAVNSSASDVSINDAPNYAVAFNNASGSSLEDCSIYSALYTGVKISGGSATVARCSFTQSTSTAINVQGGAAATLDSNLFDGVLSTTDEDGYAITIADSSADLLGNQVLSAGAGGVYATASDLTVTGDSYTNGSIGLYLYEGTFEGSGLTVAENVALGLFLVGEGGVSLSDSVISVTDGTQCNNPYSSFWSDSGSLVCGGLVAAAGTITLSNVEVYGYDTYGMYVVTFSGSSTQTLTGVNIHDVGRHGMIITPGDGTANISDSLIEGVREPELVEPCGDQPSMTGQYSLNNSPGMYLLGGDFTISNTQFLNNVGWGIASSGANVTLSGNLFDGFGCSGIVNLQGSLNASGNTFTHGDSLGSLWDYQGSSVLTGNAFVDNHAWVYYDYGDGAYEYNGAAQDIQAGQSSGIIISGNTFTDGDSSILLASVASAEISENTWSEYDSEVLVVQDSSNVLLSDNHLNDSYGYFLSAYGSSAPQVVAVNGLVIKNNRPTESITRYYDAAGVQTAEYISESMAFESFYANNASLDIVELTMENIGEVYYTFYFYDASVSLDTVSITDGNTFLLGYWYDSPPDVSIQDLEVGILDGSLVQINNYTASTGSLYLSDIYAEQATYGAYTSGMVEVEVDDMVLDTTTSSALYFTTGYYDTDGDGVSEELQAPSVSIQHLTVTDAYGYGIYSQAAVTEVGNSRLYSTLSNGIDVGGDQATLAEVIVDSAQGTGINVSSASLSIENSEVGAATSNGVAFSGGDMTLNAVQVGSAGTYGIYGIGGSLSLDGIQVGASAIDGIWLSGSTLTVINSYSTGLSGNGLSISNGSVDISNNDLSDNAGYGMVCTGVTLSSCNTNDLSNNLLGMHSGCDDACGSF